MNLNFLNYLSLGGVRIQLGWFQSQEKDLPYTAVAVSFQFTPFFSVSSSELFFLILVKKDPEKLEGAQ